MQFKAKLNVAPVVRNEYGEAAPGEYKIIRCVVLNHGKEVRDTLASEFETADLQVMARSKKLAHYQDIIANKDLVFEFRGRDFKMTKAEEIFDLAGRPKYMSIALRER